MMNMKEQVHSILEALMKDSIRIESIEVSNPINKVTNPDGTVTRDKSEIYITIRAYKEPPQYD